MGHDNSSVENHHGEVHKSHKKEYIIVFVVLAVLTVLEVLAAELPLTKLNKGIVLTAFAVVKAAIVGFYYMHLKDETKWLKFISLVPLMAGVYAAVLCLEAIFKPV